MSDTEYDPVTCITAGELREVGIKVPASIPDVGWVPRASINMNSISVRSDDNGVMLCDIGIIFMDPFRWVEGTYVLEDEIVLKD